MPEFPQLPPPPALVVVVSGPSGVGKSVLCDRLMAGDPTLVRTITTTTRSPRPGERQGVDYNFWTPAQFRQGIADGYFLEHAEVHGHLYGTPRSAVDELLARRRSPLLNVDVQGGRAVKTAIELCVAPDRQLSFAAAKLVDFIEAFMRGAEPRKAGQKPKKSV